MASNIVIDIAAEFTGKKAFNQTEKAIDKLGNTLKKAVLGASVLALTNQAIKAFSEEEKSAKLLANTLQNLGFGMATQSVEAFISQLQLATGVSDSELRPAMAKLVSALGSVTLAQDALSLAMDVSAASGISLDTVVRDLAAAQLGNFKGLKKYNLGLTQFQLKTMSATEVLARFNKIFGGGAAVAADTFAGKLARINVAIDEARESLGKGIIDALMVATGSQDIEALQQKIIDFGTYAGEAIRNLGKVVKDLLPVIKTVGIAFAALWTLGKVQAGVTATIKILGGINKAMKALRVTALTTAIAQAFVLNPLGGVAVAAGIIATIAAVGVALDNLDTKWTALGKKSTDFFGQTDGMKFGERFDLTKYKAAQAEEKKQAALEKKNADALRKAEEKAAKDRAKLAAQELAAKQKKEKLSKAEAMLELQRININAALQGKISDDEKLRLELQRAILNEDAELAEKLQKKLEASQVATAKLSAEIKGIKPGIDPFAATLASLEGIAALLTKISGMSLGSSLGGTKNVPKDPTDIIPPEVKVPDTNKEDKPVDVVVVDTQTPEPPSTNNQNLFSGLGGSTGGFGFSLPSYLQGTIGSSNVTVNVNVEGSLLTQDEVVKTISEAVVTANTNGYNTNRPGAVPPENS